MLAPRKTLWSTPPEAIVAAIQGLEITEDDTVFDVGCGDGRFLITCAQQSGARCVGIEIDEERASQARTAVAAAGLEDLVEIRAENALESDLSGATVFFLYLVPRGLRVIFPVLENLNTKLRVATYMAGFADKEPIEVMKITPEHQPDARWPLYLYEFTNE